MPVLEAMASGLPVVSTDCLGIRTFCKHGDNCLVAAADDATGGLALAFAAVWEFAKCAAAGLAQQLLCTREKVVHRHT
jgi:glycosyltransferase involved in cell wall biosynthesis